MNYDAVTTASPLATVVGLSNVTDVFTLINAYAPAQGATIGAITFDFGNGTSESDALVAGSNVRDYYDGSFANTLSSATAENAFSYTNAYGGAGTDNTADGDFGTYLVDEQDFALGPAAVGQTLTSIMLTTLGGNGENSGFGNGTPIILGMTVETASAGGGISVPEPASVGILVIGLFGLVVIRRRASV